VNRYTSEFRRHCQGASDTDRYFVAMNVSAGKVGTVSGGPGGKIDEVLAFDRAESTGTYIGQVNAIRVSSFCSPHGLVWGYDAARATPEPRHLLTSIKQWDGSDVPIYRGTVLTRAAKSLFGTRQHPRFPLSPGTLLPVAMKEVEARGPAILFAGCAVGIRSTEGEGASVLMEVADVLSPSGGGESPRIRLEAVRRHLAESVLIVARNQGTKVASVFVKLIWLRVDQDEVGCCMSFVPYFRLAADAMPAGGLDVLRTMSLDDWIRWTGETSTQLS